MKRVLFLILAVLLCAGTVFAETISPEATVKEIVSKMKTAGNPAVIVEYVNWTKAFAQFPEKQKEQLNLKSAAEMKDFFREMLAHPSVVMKKQMESKLETVPADKQEEAKQSIVKIEQMMKAKEDEMRERLTTTVYEVGAAKVDGDQAHVQLTQIYKDQKRTEDVTLEKDGDRWMLPSVNMVNSAGKAPEHPGTAPVAPPAPGTGSGK